MENSTEFTTNPHHELQQKLLYFLQNTVQTAGGIIINHKRIRDLYPQNFKKLTQK